MQRWGGVSRKVVLAAKVFRVATGIDPVISVALASVVDIASLIGRPPSRSVGASSSSQCACVTCARFYSLYDTSSSSSAKGKRERASCPRICASSSVVRPREREAAETAEEREAS